MKYAAAVAALLGSTSCFYTYENPIERRPNNSISGSVALADANCGSSPQNVVVTLLWTSGYKVRPSASGDYTVLGLPDGVYVVRYDAFDPDAGPDAGPLCTGLLPNVQLPRVGGQSDALDLGVFSLSRPVTVTGTVDVDGGGVVIGAFEPDPPGSQGNFESFATQADPTGHFALTLPQGHHVVWLSSPTLAVPVDVVLDGGTSIDGGLQVDLGRIVLFPTDAGTNSGFVDGNIVLSLAGFGAGADGGAVGALLGPGGVNVEINPPLPTAPTVTNQLPGLGVQMTQPVPPGHIFDIFCGLKSEGNLTGPDVLNDIELPHVPTFVGRPTTLGQITWITNGLFEDAGLSTPCNYSTVGCPGYVAPDGGADAGVDAGSDAGVDGGSDAGVDAGTDAGVDAGIDAGFDAGPPAPPQWYLLGDVPVPSNQSTVVPLDTDAGTWAFFELGNVLAGAVFGAGGAGAAQLLSGFSISEVDSAILDSAGVPMVHAGENSSNSELRLFRAQLDGGGCDGGWCAVSIIDDAGTVLFPNDYGALLAAPAGGNPWLPGATAYYVLPDPSEMGIDLAAFVPALGSFQLVATFPFLDGGGGGYAYDLNAAVCDLDGDPGLCLAVLSSTECAMSIDLKTGLASPGYQLQQSANFNPSKPKVISFGDAGVFVGWSELGATLVWVSGLPGSAFACDPTVQSCAPPIQGSIPALIEDPFPVFDFMGLGNQPLVVVPTGFDAGLGLYSPYGSFDVFDLASFQSLNVPGTSVLTPSNSGFATNDLIGAPLVGGIVDAGSTLSVELYRYH